MKPRRDMTHVRQTKTRWMSVGLMLVFLFVICSSFLITRNAHAQDPNAAAAVAGAQAQAACHAAPFSPPCIGASIKDTATILGDRIVSPTFRIALIQGLLNISQFVVNRLAYEAALVVANGGPGQGSLFYGKSAGEGFAEFGLEVAGESVAELSDAVNSSLGTKFDLCVPSGSLFSLSLQLGIKQKYQPQKPRCDIMEVIDNWDSFVSDAYSSVTDPEKIQSAIISKFAESLQPGRNELSAAVTFNLKVDQEVSQKKQLEVLERTTQKPATKDVKDPVTGKTETPAPVVEADFLDKIKKAVTGETTQLKASEIGSFGDAMGGLALTAASTFTNTLLSQLFNKIYSGLFDSSPDSQDPFNVEAIAETGQDPETFSRIFATTPVATASYNALTEFVVCPPQGIANRGLNNCVMDSNFLSAISRGSSGVPLTVQEAIDEGLINGKWPMISPENLSQNQDPLCYTYGFCYANLVKLRKARVLPIGWELAALRNSVSQPKTLQEIINEFSNCNQYGGIDAQHPFCHLIDPNWVLKYPDTQCRATVNGEIRLTQLSPGRQTVCADSPSCLGENSKGECVDGYGYCVREKNVWRFRGDECPAQYAGCLALRSTTTQQQHEFIINTVNFSVCNQKNAGCQWYRTTKNPVGDSYDWLLPSETYLTADREDDWKYQQTNGVVSDQVSYVSGTPATYTYQERVYFTRAAQACSPSDAGCSELLPAEGAVLNGLRNPSFEQDDDKDGVPDNWFLQSLQKSDVSLEVNKPAARGSRSLKMLKTGIGSLIQYVPIKANQFYTFSFFAISDATGAIGAGQSIEVLDHEGKKVELKGTALFGCSYDGTNKQILVANNATKEWKRFTCTFSAPETSTQIKVALEADKDVRYDGIQLEPSEVMNDFVEGFSDGDQPQKTIKIAPDYLNCTGAATDSAACVSYAQMCQAQDVGCTLYTPDDGDPALPAITSPLDICPAECVGYDTFKQEQTAYESEKFPLYFIPTQAKSCSAQFVGCDSFTNLSSAAEGGEGVEYYTNLRACTTEKMADGSSNKQKAAFYTWEGSDNAGYQLRSWNLLESNLSDSASMDIFGAPFVNGALYKEKNIGKAPCTKWKVSAKDQLVCIDDAPDDGDADILTHQLEIQINATCDEHTDIFSNPDCREFFDADGFVHYREFSKTVTVSDQCQPYRKDQSTQTDCADAGGFWDAEVGFCRYFGLKGESIVCPGAANGCRAYTGGAGRNSVTILSETFENGSYSGFEGFASVAASNGLLISNESIATDGHSLRVTAGAGTGGIATYHAYLGGTVINKTYNPNDASTCTAPKKITPAGCEITSTCIVGSGENSCGTLVNKMVKGDSFVVQFWAKGNGNLYLGFRTLGGLGGNVFGIATEASIPPVTTSYEGVALNGVALDGSWRAYQLGPFDSSKANQFTKDAVLFFLTDAGKTFYLDNLTLKQVEENITLVKNSWVVPSTCDTAPNGVNTPQYYLGCEAYTDQNAKSHNLYQFSKLCSEKVVGCEMFYQTFQSESPYSAIHNAQCVRGTKTSVGGNPTVDLTPPQVTTTPVDCVVNGKTFCTIAAGRGSCTFDYDGTFDEKLPLDGSTGFGIVFGPETVVVPADRPVYIVDNGSADCSASNAGCQEVGKPKFTQDLSKVESFGSAYFLNDPDQYGDILCDNEALFCDEYSSTKDGNFYFKSPMDKQCEYKASVEIDGKKFAGWFRKGQNEPCYWTDVNPKDGKFTPGKDTAYITSGDQVSIWKNGDSNYDGWVGACSTQYDLCSEFIDIVDTEGGLKKDGTSYYFVNNDKLTQAATQGSGACNGKVSQKAGCALFNNRSKAELNYNASVTYVLSTHADELLKKTPDALVDPVSCNGSGGVFKNKNGIDIDLCKSRCLYNVATDDALTTNMSALKAPGQYYERSCLTNTDCPTIKTKNDKDAQGTCVNTPPDFKLSNDSNTVLKVTRDRSCSAWLACDSARTSFNERTNKYEPICDSIDLCTRGGALGQTAACTQWSARDPQILTDDLYSARDVTWNGYELSGFAVPNQLPVELYDQFNLNPEKTCESKSKFTDANNNQVEKGDRITKDGNKLAVGQPPVSCSDESECQKGTCVQMNPDFRLVYNAGSCDSTDGNGGSCKVGHCSKTGNACSKSEECAGSGNVCVIGSCQETKPANNGTCSGGFKYDPQKDACVDKFLGEQDCLAGPEAQNGCTGNQVCVESATTAIGKCFNNRCLTDIQDGDGNGYADPIQLTAALDQSCRGYPEVDSPYPVKVVEQWITPGKTPGQPQNELSKPYSYKTGYQDSKVCAIDAKGNPVDCDCSYDKIEYGQGAVSLFESTGMNPAELPTGFCLGGPYEGIECGSDKDCTDYSDKDKPDAGTCLKKTAQDTLYGWSGYCIEKDSSIQLYASTEAKDRACLTWLPVDQLSGATDLYAKYTSAGFEPADVSYCVDVGLAYDIGWDQDYHCAETQDGNCNDAFSVSAYKDDDPDDDVSCPPGFFAVMTGCGDASSGDKCEETWGDDDYPYFCVPRLAYHTKDAQGNPIEKGERCNLPAEESLLQDNGKPFVDYASSDGTDIYFIGSDAWNTYFNASKDCKVKGVFENDATWQSYFGPPGQTDTSRTSLDPYPACQSYLQVSKQSDPGGNLNAAWTNRVWEQAGFQIEGPNKDTVGYIYGSSPTPFGRATDFLQKLTSVADPYPHRIAMCQKGNDSVLPLAKNGECPANDYQKVGVNQARSYTQLTMSIQTPAYNSQTCKNFNCVCISDIDCNAKQLGGDPITCEQFVCNGGKQNGKSCQGNNGDDAEKCVDDGGKCVGTCQGGAQNGDACADESACWDNICQQSYFGSERFCGAKTGTIYTLNKESDYENAAKKRLQQVFAQSYFLRGFQNAGVYPDVSGKPGNYSSVYDYLTGLFDTLEGTSNKIDKVFVDNTVGNWKWDNRVSGDPQTGEKPKPPTVWALGPCTGTKCREGKEGAITINDQDQGDVFGKTAKKITVSFFAAANSNQMPIRQMIVDWGDGKNTTPPWPTDSQSPPSPADDNFYKNHRGLNGGGEEYCSSGANEFGLAPEACSASYIAFSHDYVCTSAQVKKLQDDPRSSECKYASDGRLLNSPCTDGKHCIFQPRVHVKDNWGWCTGFCNAGSDGTNGCFAGNGDENNECQPKHCPSKSDGKAVDEDCPDYYAADSAVVNPWVNYSGYVIIEPEI